jgi:hypothetical protein
MPRTLAHRLFLLAAVIGVVALGPAAVGAAGSSKTAVGAKKVNPKDGRYKGFVGPDTIHFKVTDDGRRITHLVTTYNPAANCSIPTADQTESFGTLKIQDASFRGRTTDVVPSGGTPQSFSIDGHFVSDTRADGTIHGHLVVTSLPPCNDHQPFRVSRANK